MAVHKVPQDVEADDKFLGPLSFKQFIFFGATLICGYLTFLTFTRVWPISFIFLLPTIAFAFLAVPWSKEQPTELWLASRIRFLIVPHKRIWDQTGMKDLVHVTVPVREAHLYTDGLSQDDVRNRLGALASIVDSRGWAIKNVLGTNDSNDRLISVSTIPSNNSAAQLVGTTPDMFDDSEGTIARQFDDLIKNSEMQHKSETLKLVDEARHQSPANSSSGSTATGSNRKLDPSKEQDFWFMHNQPAPEDPSLAVFQNSTVVAPGTDAGSISPVIPQTSQPQMSEEELLETVHKKKERDSLQTSHHYGKVIDPRGTTDYESVVNPKSKIRNPKENISPMTTPVNPDILNLAKSNDLNVETIARQANKKGLDDQSEVVINLH